MLLLDPKPSTQAYVFADDGDVPNSRLPAVVYRNVINLTGLFPDKRVHELQDLVRDHGWRVDWAEADAVYRYTHYHSTAHEVLVVLEGNAELRVGGRNGAELVVHAGDAIALPAGVGHRRLRRGKEFSVAGLYPLGQRWDLRRLRDGGYERAKRIIPKVPLPDMDPLYGKNGPLLLHWK